MLTPRAFALPLGPLALLLLLLLLPPLFPASAIAAPAANTPAAAPAAAAAGPITMTGALELTQNYRPNAWQPVRIELRNASDAIVNGSVVLPLSGGGGDDDAPATMRLPVSVPPRSAVRVSVAGYFPRLELAPAKRNSNQQADLPPLTVAEFRTADGTLHARTPIMGLPIGVNASGGGGGGSSGDGGDAAGHLIAVVNPRGGGDLAGEAYDVESLAASVGKRTGTPLAVAGITLDALAREPQGLRPLRALVLDGAVDPDALDAAQRDAVMNYLRGGGVVLLTAPDVDAVGRAGTWLAPLLPVRVIGTRQASQVAVSDGGPTLTLRGALPIVEAVDYRGGDGGGDDANEILLRDRDYVHVAERRVGLGKVVFTSFPINALADGQQQQQQAHVAALWRRLLALDPSPADLDQWQLARARPPILASMIGRKVASWRVAAALAGGYVLVIALAQGLFLGAARPRAFAVSVAAALLLAGTLLAMGVARRQEQSLQAARLAVVDLAPDGGGVRQEAVAYVGADLPELPLRAADERVMIRPAIADARNRPAVTQHPFAVDRAGVFAERIERVWEAIGPADPAQRVRARAQFGPDGLTLDVENGLGATIESPLLLWNGRAVAMADVPSGRTTVRAFQYNPRQQFTGLDAIQSDLSRRRAAVIAASLTPSTAIASDSPAGAAPAPPVLVGWIADREHDALIVAGLTERGAVETRSMVMVRTPLGANVAPPGSAIFIPSALVQVDTGRMPYDHARGESVATPQPGSWRIRFAPPPQAGRVRPTRITVSARVSVPAHTMRLRPASRGADEAGEWSRQVGALDMTLDCSARDHDADGAVEMVLDVESQDPGGSVFWQISDLVATMDGVVIGSRALPPPAPLGLAAATRPAAAEESTADPEAATQEKQVSE